MVVIKVLDDEALFVIHDEQDLLYGWVTIETLKIISHTAQTQKPRTKTTYQTNRTPFSLYAWHRVSPLLQQNEAKLTFYCTHDGYLEEWARVVTTLSLPNKHDRPNTPLSYPSQLPLSDPSRECRCHKRRMRRCTSEICFCHSPKRISWALRLSNPDHFSYFQTLIITPSLSDILTPTITMPNDGFSVQAVAQGKRLVFFYFHS